MKMTNPTKIRQALKRLGQTSAPSKAEPGVFIPIVNRARCEGKMDCVEVCPHEVFEVTRIKDEDYRALPWLARMKVAAHGRKTAYTPNAEKCTACDLCVVACPEKAIELVQVGA